MYFLLIIFGLGDCARLSGMRLYVFGFRCVLQLSLCIVAPDGGERYEKKEKRFSCSG